MIMSSKNPLLCMICNHYVKVSLKVNNSAVNSFYQNITHILTEEVEVAVIQSRQIQSIFAGFSPYVF